MTEPIYLLLGIHHHQPVGNFDAVFAQGFSKCYWPFLETLRRHPSLRISIHHSGALIDWAQKHDVGYLDCVTEMASTGQIEILGGGYYEPILPILKYKDARGQIEMMQLFWEKRIGKRPRGMWLAERVWEPQLAALLCDAGISYTILDDQHFHHAGLTQETLFGYWLTERAGKSVSIFPSNRTLRYLIPFKYPEDVITHLIHLQEHHPGQGITYGDDGEKFGLWPGTHEWVVEKGWLNRFFSLLEENRDRIRTVTFSEFKAQHNPSGTVYLPTASYPEMLEWAMPAEAILNYEDTKRAIESLGIWDRARPFYRGGFWDNFFAKYPESNFMHKRTIYTSNRLDAMEAKGHDLGEAWEYLYRAQCNCAYWHGLFGGLYLNYLRHAVYENLIEADWISDKAEAQGGPFVRVEIADIDCDGKDETIIASEKFFLVLKPSLGGSLVELDFRPKKFNLLNTLARRLEAYHVQKSEHRHIGQSVESIHDRPKELGDLEGSIAYDRTPRHAFLDHAFEKEPDWEAMSKGKSQDAIHLDTLEYTIAKSSKDTQGTSVLFNAGHGGLSIGKQYLLTKAGRLEVHYQLRHSGNSNPPLWFATEINFTLLAGHSADRYYQWDGVEAGRMLMDTRQVLKGIGMIEAYDLAFSFRVRIEAPVDRIVILPVETVSQSESGFERLYQGSVIWLGWKPSWKKTGEANFSVGILVEPL